MLKKTVWPALLLALLCAASPVGARQRGPSTPEERRKAVAMADFLEKNPLAKEAKQYRTELFGFLAEVPDITVSLCTNVLGESKQIKGDYEAELVGQLVYSQAKFIIENPDKAGDQTAVFVGGVEGVLRTWQAIKAAKPKAKFKLMDELLARQQAGTLAELVKANASGCK